MMLAGVVLALHHGPGVRPLPAASPQETREASRTTFAVLGAPLLMRSPLRYTKTLHVSTPMNTCH